MKSRCNVVFVALALVAAGCLVEAPGATPVVSTDVPIGAEIRAADLVVSGLDAMIIGVPEIRADAQQDPEDGEMPACVETPTNCHDVPFSIVVPSGFWAELTGGLEVSYRTEPGDEQWATIAFQVRDADSGAIVGQWVQHDDNPLRTYSAVILLDQPTTADYIVTFAAQAGATAFEAAFQFEVQPREAGPVRELLPNLRTMVPSDLKIDLPRWGNVIAFEVPAEAREASGAGGIRGCAHDEVAEERAARCLRVSSAVSNYGEGPLEVWMAEEDLGAAARGNGQFYQRVFSTDGSFQDMEAAGGGLYHSHHAHLHYPDLVHLNVYEYNVANQQRGDEVGRGQKSGFCFANEGLAELGLPGTRPVPQAKLANPEHTAAGGNPAKGGECIIPDEGRLYMGVAPNWFDMYETYRTGQYAEISGVPDGTYLLEAVIDPANTVLESDETDNASAVVFRLTGDEIEILGHLEA